MRKTALTCTALAGTLFLGGSSISYEAVPTVSSSSAQPEVGSSGSSYNSNTSTGSSDNGFFFILDPVTQHDKQVLGRSFQQAESFWAQRYNNLIGITATKLAILTNDDQFNCPSQDGKPEYIQASDPSGTEYCQKLGTIVITEGLVNYIHQKTSNSDPVLEFFIDHEFGHTIQAAAGILKPGETTSRAQELQADCDAGIAAHNLNPGNIPAIENFLPLLPPDDSRHSTPQQRTASFVLGTTSTTC